MVANSLDADSERDIASASCVGLDAYQAGSLVGVDTALGFVLGKLFNASRQSVTATKSVGVTKRVMATKSTTQKHKMQAS